MSALLAYTLGVVTLPALAGALYVLARLFVYDGATWQGCAICSYEARSRVPVIRKAKWAWHEVTRRPTRAHRAGVDAYQREWKLGKYAERDS